MSSEHMVPLHDAILVERKKGNGNNGRWRLDRTIRLGDVLVILVIIVGGLASYMHMDFRVQKLEAWRVDQSVQMVTINQTLEARGEAVRLLQELQRMVAAVQANYPPHRHIESGKVMYPPGSVPPRPEKP